MNNPRDQHLEALSEIRSMMERSSRFISLSGLSGVAAGFFALLGAAMAYWYLEAWPFQREDLYYVPVQDTYKWGMSYQVFFLLDAALVLLAALAGGIFFTTRKARRRGQKIWDALTKRLLLNLAIPLLAGGLFCAGLLYHGLSALVAPATLVFYGLGLVNASKYTLHDIRYLGLSEIALGIVALFFPGYGLECWAIGFGILHILYGTLMYFKYERTAPAA